MFTFNSRGLLEPVNSINCSLVDLEKHFVEDVPSKTRRNIFNNYLDYSAQLKQLLNVEHLRQWINGSFVTKVINPKDIDLVTFVDAELYLKHEKLLKGFISNKNWRDLGVDAYLIVVRSSDDKLFIRTESDRTYWMDHFTKTRQNPRSTQRPRKGFLEINY